MQQAWIPLACTACDNQWQARPSELPAPDATFTCPQCGATQPMSAFVKTQESLQILEEFHK